MEPVVEGLERQPDPSPVTGPDAVQASEPVNQWYPWCQVFTVSGQHVQQWMPGENQQAAFDELVAWLDIHYPIGAREGWLEHNGSC